MSKVTIPVQWITFVGVHDYHDTCRTACVMHNPSRHHMRHWTLHWRNDRGIFERLCPEHGTGHPDPDQFAYWRSIDQEWQIVHGCCGCCAYSQEIL